MKRRVFSLILCLCMMFSMISEAVAAGIPSNSTSGVSVLAQSELLGLSIVVPEGDISLGETIELSTMAIYSDGGSAAVAADYSVIPSSAASVKGNKLTANAEDDVRILATYDGVTVMKDITIGEKATTGVALRAEKDIDARTLTVYVEAAENPGVASFNMEIAYDNTYLIPVKAESTGYTGNLMSNIEDPENINTDVVVTQGYSDSNYAGKDLYAVTFEILEAAYGETKFDLNVLDASNEVYEDVKFTSVSGTSADLTEVVLALDASFVDADTVEVVVSATKNEGFASFNLELTANDGFLPVNVIAGEYSGEIISNIDEADAGDTLVVQGYGASDYEETAVLFTAVYDVVSPNGGNNEFRAVVGDAGFNTEKYETVIPDVTKAVDYLTFGSATLDVTAEKVTVAGENYIDVTASALNHYGIATFIASLSVDNEDAVSLVSSSVSKAANYAYNGTLVSNQDENPDSNVNPLYVTGYAASNQYGSTAIPDAQMNLFTARYKLLKNEDVTFTLSYVDGDFCDEDLNSVTLLDNPTSVTVYADATVTLTALTLSASKTAFFTDDVTGIDFTATATYSDGTTAVVNVDDDSYTVTPTSTYDVVGDSLTKLQDSGKPGEAQTVTVTAVYEGVVSNTVNLTAVNPLEDIFVTYVGESMTLADVALPEGWKWKNSSIALEESMVMETEAIYGDLTQTVVVAVSVNVDFVLEASYYEDGEDRLVDVTLVADDNQGFASYQTKISYDNAVVTPVQDSYRADLYTGSIQQPEYDASGSITLIGYNDANYYAYGNVYSVTFRVNDSVVNYEDLTTYFSLVVDAVCNEQLDTIVPDVDPRASVVIPALPEVRNDKWTLSASEIVDGKFTVYVNTPVNDGFASFTTALTYTSDNEDLVVKPVSVTAVDYPGMITTSEVQDGYIAANPVKLQGANASDYFGNGQLLAVVFEVVEEATGTVTFTLDINEGDMICTEDYKEVVPTFEGTTVSVVKEDRVDEWVLSASEIEDGKFTVYVSTPANEGFASFTTALSYVADNADLVVKPVSVASVNYPGSVTASEAVGGYISANPIIIQGANDADYLGTDKLLAIEFEVVKEATGTVSFTMDIAEDGDICTEDYKDVVPTFVGTEISIVKEERVDEWTLSASEITDNKFTVYVNTPVNEGFASFTTALSYATDNEDLVVKPVSVASVNYPGSVTASEAVGGYINANPMIIQGANASDYFGTEALLAITFEIVEIADGTVTFTMDIAEDGNICTEDYEDVVPTFEGTSVTVVAPEEPEAPILNMDAVYVSTEEDGRYIDVTLSVERNSGFASFDVDVAYDANALVPTTITKGDYIGSIGTVEFAELNGIVPIVGYNDADFTEDGDLVTIRFRVKDDVLTETVVSFSAAYEEGDFCDEDKKTVNPENNTPCEATIAGAALELIANPAAIAKNETTVFITNVLAYSTVDNKAYVLEANVTPDSMTETAGILAIAADMKSAEGIALGDTVVTAKYKGLEAEANVNVYSSVTSIQVIADPMIILTTGTANLTTLANGTDVVDNSVVEYTAMPAGIVSITDGVVSVVGDVDSVAIVTVTGSYAGLTDDAVIIIVKAPDEIVKEFFEGLTLADVALPAGWSWVDDTIALAKNSSASYKAVYTDEANSVESEVVVTVGNNVSFNMDATYVSTQATGRYIDVVLSAENNQGFATFDVDVAYDATALVPVSITKGDFTGTVTELDPDANYNGSIAVVGYSDTDYEEDGVLATIRFKVLDDVLHETTVNFAADYTLGDVCNDEKKTIMPENKTACEATIAATTLELIADPDVIDEGETTAFTLNVLATSTEDGSTYVLIADVTADTISDSEGILTYAADNKSATGNAAGETTVTASYKNLTATDIVTVNEVVVENTAFVMDATYVSTEADGRYVDVVLSVENNQGFASFDVDVAYDKNVLTPVTITKGDYTGNIAPVEFAELDGTIALVGYNDANFAEDGVLATIRFKVSDDVLTETVVNFSATYADGDVCDEDKVTVSPENKTACEATIAAATLELIANPASIATNDTTAFTTNVLVYSTEDGSNYILTANVTPDTMTDSAGILAIAADKKSAEGMAVGDTVVTATYKGLTADADVNVYASITSIDVTVAPTLILATDTANLTTVANGEDVVNNAVVEYTAVPAGIVSIENGVVSVIGEIDGKAVVTITGSYAELTDDAVLTIVSAPEDQSIAYFEGVTLSDVALPEGWAWVDGSIALSKASDDSYKAFYTENGATVEAEVVVHVSENVTFNMDATYVSTEATGRYIDVVLSAENNQGFATFDVDVTYDATTLVPVSITKGDYTGTVTELDPDANYNGSVAVVGYGDTDYEEDGVLATIRFKVLDDVLHETTVNFAADYTLGDVCNDEKKTIMPENKTACEATIAATTLELIADPDVIDEGETTAFTLNVLATSTEDGSTYVLIADVTADTISDSEGILSFADDQKSATGNAAGVTTVTASYKNLTATDIVTVNEVIVPSNIAFTMDATYVSNEAEGRYVDVVLSVENNDGFASFDVDVAYDKNVLTPVTITKGDYTGNIAPVEFAELDGTIALVGYNDANFAEDGVLATIRFKVSDDVLTETVVNFSATYADGDVCDENKATVSPENKTACEATIAAASLELIANPDTIDEGETTAFTVNVLATSTEDGSTYVLIADVTADTMSDSEGILTYAAGNKSAVGNAAGVTTVTASYKNLTATDIVTVNEVIVPSNIAFVMDATYVSTEADGRYVDVVLSVENNDGFASFDVDVAYNKNVLTPVTITKGDYTGNIAPVEFAELDGTIALVGYSDSNYTEDGVLATIRFKVSNDVLTETVVNFSATYAEGDVCDENKATVSPENKTACEATIAAAKLELIANPAAIAKDATTALTTNVLVYSTVDNSTYVLIADVTADTMTESAGILTIADDKKSATGNVVGDTIVTATYKGLTATADVNVYGTVTSIEVSVDPILILDTDTANLTTIANGSETVNNNVVAYTAVPAGIVSIENGVVTVIGEIDGKAVVTITGSYAGLIDDAVLTIVEAPEEQSIAYFEGVTLSDVALPEGWAWVDGSIALTKASDNSYKAVYTENGATVEAEVVVHVTDNVQFNMNATYVSTQATGRYIDVVLSAANNQGFASFDVDVTYDAMALRPVSITKGDYIGSIADVDFATLNGAVPVVGYNDADYADDGVLATVRFEVLDSVLAETVVNFAATYGAGDVCNDDNKTIMPENNTACMATIDAVSAELTADPAAIEIGETTEFTMNILAVSTEDGSTYVLLSDVTADTMTDSEGILTIAVDTMSATGNGEGTTIVTADYKGVVASTMVNVYVRDSIHTIEVSVEKPLILTTETATLTTVANGVDTVDNRVVTYTANSNVVTIENGIVTVTGEVADKVVVTITGEYAGLTDDATLTIVKAPNPIEVDYEDGLTLEDAPLPEGWAWVDPTTPLTEGSENAYKATYTENGETVEADVTVKVNAVTPEKQPSFALDAVYVLDTNTESETYGDRFVDVTLSVKDNTGIASFTLNMGYNKDVVTPVSVQKDLYTGGITLSEDLTANPLTIVGASTTDITADGALFTVRFAVADDVLAETVLDGFTVSYDVAAGAICNAALETVEVTPNPVTANAITIPKATIDMTPDTISLKKGKTKDVKVEVTYYASTDYENAETAVVDVTDSADLDLTMEDTKIATISGDTVTAKKAGTTELTAEYFGVLSDTTKVKVTTSSGPSSRPVETVLNKEQHGRYILGYPDNTMQPNRNITREEVAVIFYRLLTESAKQSYYSTDVSMLNDVAADSWSAVQIGTLVKMGIIVGYEDGTFRPHDAITRAEFAAIACRFDNLTNAPDAGFADVQGHWAKTYIDNAYAFGWIVGYEDGTFRPQNNITRAEAVTIINRVLGRNTDEAGVLEAKDIDTLAQLKQWTDLDETHWAFYQFLEATYSHEYVRREGGTKGIENWTNLNEALNMD